jgi:serine/threonine-protein kinase
VNPELLHEIADAIADGREVDWARAETHAADDDHLLAQLRVLQKVAETHRATTEEAAPTIASPHRGAQWHGLTILGRIAGGSYGAVYRAWDPHLEREVALKLLRTRAYSAESLSGILREARLLARVRHPNVITVYGAARSEGRVGIWMELIEGATLVQIVEQNGPLAAIEAALIGVAMSDAVAAVHAAGIIHRDLTAANVMRARGGRLVLMDFGTGAERTGDALGLVGTPVYIAPEVLEGATATVQSDVYSLGILLSYLVTGVYPVSGQSIEELRTAHASGRRRLLHDLRADLPPAFLRVVARATAPQPAHRFNTAGELRSALAEILPLATHEASGPARSVVRWTSVVAATVAALLLGGFVFGRAEPEVRRITYRTGRVLAARFAGDDRSLVYTAQWGAGPRQIYATSSTGVDARVVAGPDVSLLAVSRKGELAVLERPKFLRGYVESGTLAVLPLDGGTSRALADNVLSADWSPSGDQLAVVRVVDNTIRVEYPLGSPVYETTGWVSNLRVRPDADGVAFVDHPIPADDGGSVVFVRSGHPPRVLSQGWSTAQGLAWRSDREIWFSGSRSGNTRAVYAVDLRGRSRRVSQMLESLHVEDVSASGDLLVTQQSIRVAAHGRGAKDSSERDLSWLDWSLVRDINGTADRLLVNESGEGGGPQYSIYLRGFDAGTAVRLGTGSGLALSSDSRLILALVPDSGSMRRLAVVPVGAGPVRLLPSAGLLIQPYATWLDANHVLFTGAEPAHVPRIFVQEVNGNAPPQPFSAEGIVLASADAVSPDRTRVAAIDREERPVLLTNRGVLAEGVPHTESGEWPAAWDPDGGSIFVWHRGVAPARIERVSVTTGARTLWRVLMPDDPAGVHEVLRVVIEPGVNAYAYSFSRELSSLHVIRGLR